MRRRLLRRRLLWTAALLALLLLTAAATAAHAALAAAALASRTAGRFADTLTTRRYVMRRSFPLVLAAVAAVVALGGVQLAGASPSAAPLTMSFVSVDVGASEAYVDVGREGESPGDRFFFSERLYRGGKKVGRTDVACELVTRTAMRCFGTLSLGAGRLEVGGLIRNAGRTFGVPVLGGAGVYAGAAGVLRITELSESRDRYVVRLTA
jgi:hypothetical protein